MQLTHALLRTDAAVRTLVGLALASAHRRGHGAVYGGLNHGRCPRTLRRMRRMRRTDTVLKIWRLSS